MAFQQKSISRCEEQCSVAPGSVTNCWEKGTLPQELRDAVIVSLFKNNGDESDNSHHRCITVLSIAGKILARVLLNRLIQTTAQEHTPDGFRSNRGTTDMIFAETDTEENRTWVCMQLL